MENFDKELLREYADLKAQEKSVKSRIAEIGPVIKAAMEGKEADKIESDFGSFTLVPMPVWEFSPAVEEAEKKVDDLKAEEKANGTAKETIRKDLKFAAPKPPKAEIA